MAERIHAWFSRLAAHPAPMPVIPELRAQLEESKKVLAKTIDRAERTAGLVERRSIRDNRRGENLISASREAATLLRKHGLG